MRAKHDKTEQQKKFSAERARGYNESHVDPEAYKRFKAPSFFELGKELERRDDKKD